MSLEAQLLGCIKSEYYICFICEEIVFHCLNAGLVPLHSAPPDPLHPAGTLSRHRCRQRRLFAPTTSCLLTRQRLTAYTDWLHTAAFTQAKLQQKQTWLLYGKEKGEEELISCLFSTDCVSVLRELPGSISNLQCPDFPNGWFTTMQVRGSHLCS